MAYSSMSGESFNNWDPMRDAFEDPNFNTYKEGPGAYLDLDNQPCSTGSFSEKRSGAWILYVGNIPEDISKQGIENIFRVCGQPLSVYRHTPTAPTNKVWAFVTFASYREAESAKRELNHKPPTYLTIEFARGSEPVNEVKINMRDNRAEYDVNSQDIPIPRKSLSRSPGTRRDKDGQFDDAMGSKENKEQRSYFALQQEENHWHSQQQDKHDKSFCGDYQSKKISPNKSNYQKEKNTDPFHIRNPSIDREAGIIEHKKDTIEGSALEKQQIHLLQNPKKSPPKQKIDTKFQNKSKRERGENQKKIEGNNSSAEEVEIASNQPKQFTQRDQTLLPEKNPSKQYTPNNNANSREPSKQFTPNNNAKDYNSRDQSEQCVPNYNIEQSPKYGSEHSVLKDHLKPSDPQEHSRQSASRDKSKQPISSNLYHGKFKLDDKTSSATQLKVHANGKNTELFHECEQLSTADYTRVKIQIAVAPGEYWVQLCSNVREIYSMSLEMGKYEDPIGQNISLGMYCMAKYEDVWYRAKIISVEPKIRVQFVDFGSEYSISEELKLLPTCVKHMKSQAIRIRLASGTSKKFYDAVLDTDLFVKQVSVSDNGIVTVHVEGETYESSLCERQSAIETDMDQDIALQNVTVLLKPNMKCYLLLIEYEDGDDFIASLVPLNLINLYNSLYDRKLNEECEKKISDNFVPGIGEAVLAKSVSEGWIRGYVVHVSPKKEFTIASCDTGLVETVKVVKKLPQNLLEIVQFAVEGRVIDNIQQAKEHISLLKNTNVIIETTTCDFAIAKVENELGDTVCKLELKKWTVPFELYEELKCVELKEGECVISAEMSAVEMYIQPMNMTCTEIYNRLMQDVQKHCFRAPIKKHTPKVGQILAAKFSEDGNFYRAVVREIHKSKGIKVQYIDFGNVEYVSQDGLKLLPKVLRDIECCVVKVLLKNVEDRPLNEEVQNFLKDLIADFVKLKVKLPDPNSNIVDLYMKDGTHVNEKINEMLVPGWKKGVTDTSIYTLSNVFVEDLELGSTAKLEIIWVIKYNAIVARWLESQVANVLENDLQTVIDEYCLQTKEPYTPREMELCLAKVDSVWQRCLCLAEGNPLDLYQLDVGRVIKASHRNIRRYRQEFSALPAEATWCEIVTKVEVTRSIQKCITKYLTTEKVILAKIVEIKEVLVGLKGYVIEIPELDYYLQAVTGVRHHIFS